MPEMDRSQVSPALLERIDNLLAWALAHFPEASCDEHWEFPAIKVRQKIVFTLCPMESTLRFTAKLGPSNADALDKPGVQPAAYSLGNKGWISAFITPQTPIDDDQLKAWAEEAFELVAPKRLVSSWKSRLGR